MNARTHTRLTRNVAFVVMLQAGLAAHCDGTDSPEEPSYQLSSQCANILASFGTSSCATPPEYTQIIDPNGQCLRDTYVGMALMYCWYAQCNASENPQGAQDADQCAENLSCLAIDLCSDAPAVTDVCRSLDIVSCMDPPALDCTRKNDTCSIQFPVEQGNCELLGALQECGNDQQCCSGECTTSNSFGYQDCCPWIYGVCSSNDDCCASATCIEGSCLGRGGSACVDDFGCASGLCDVRPTGDTICRCEDGSQNCCLPASTPCLLDAECCSHSCNGLQCD